MTEPYIAKEPIRIDGVLAFDTGHVVPDEHVKQYDLSAQVARRGTKAAEQAQNES